MNIIINVVGQKMTTNYKKIVEGSQNFVKFTFNLPDEWKEINPSACFSQGKTVIGQKLDDDWSVFLPPEIKSGECELSLYGAKQVTDNSSGDIIGTSNCITLLIDKNNSVEDMIETTSVKSVYGQWMDKVKIDTLATIDDTLKETKTAMVAATDRANTAADSVTGVVAQAAKAVADAEQAVADAEQAVADVTEAKNSINIAIDEAVSNYDFVAAIQENVTEDIMLKSEYEETIEDNTRKISEIDEIVSNLKTIPIVTELPENAKTGDICLWKELNAIDIKDSGKTLIIDYEYLTKVAETLSAGEEIDCNIYIYDNPNDLTSGDYWLSFNAGAVPEPTLEEYYLYFQAGWTHGGNNYYLYLDYCKNLNEDEWYIPDGCGFFEVTQIDTEESNVTHYYNISDVISTFNIGIAFDTKIRFSEGTSHGGYTYNTEKSRNTEWFNPLMRLMVYTDEWTRIA